MRPIPDRIYFDTNIFIYAVEHDPVHARTAAAILEAAGAFAVTSELTIAECIIGKSQSADDALLQEDYIAYFSEPANIETVSISRGLLIQAARLARSQGLKLADAIHVATALSAECRFFVTNDRKLGLRLPKPLQFRTLLPTPPAGS